MGRATLNGEELENIAQNELKIGFKYQPSPDNVALPPCAIIVTRLETMMQSDPLENGKTPLGDVSEQDLALELDEEAHQAIQAKWEQLGGEQFCYLTTDMIPCVDGIGRKVLIYLTRGKSEGAIYWHPDTGAHTIYGAIYKKWEEMDWEQFGDYPSMDTKTCADGSGLFNRIRNVVRDSFNSDVDSAIYWHPAVEAHVIYGAIYKKWARLGSECSSLGYPTSDENAGPPGSRCCTFQHGIIAWSADTGAWIVELDKS